MDIKTFWVAFAQELFSVLNEKENWFSIYSSNPLFTKVMEEVMLQIGENLKYNDSQIKIHPQHQRIDCCFGVYNDGLNEIDYAIEFENSQLTWKTKELPKLLKLKSKNKVLIHYYNYNVDTLKSIMDDLQIAYDKQRLQGIDDKFLFITGTTVHLNHIDRQRNIDCDYRAFSLVDKRFQLLQDIPIMRKLK